MKPALRITIATLGTLSIVGAYLSMFVYEEFWTMVGLGVIILFIVVIVVATLVSIWRWIYNMMK